MLIQACPPLDLNSAYSYFLLCSHFADSCVVAEQQGKLGGFLSAYIRPDNADTLFVWQVAVAEAFRGQGVAKKMLASLLSRTACSNVRFIEATVGPSNLASRALFTSLARAQGIVMEERTFLPAAAFAGQNHEPEQLLRLGPTR